MVNCDRILIKWHVMVCAWKMTFTDDKPSWTSFNKFCGRTCYVGNFISFQKLGAVWEQYLNAHNY